MNTNKLFIQLDHPDRSKTQLAFAANYLPRKELSDAAERLICWSRKQMFYRAQIDMMLNDDMTHIEHAPNEKAMQMWAIHWKYNSIPTQIEWERKSTSYIIEVEFRVIADGNKIALLSF